MSADASRLRAAIQSWAARVVDDSAEGTAEAIEPEQWIVGHPRQPFDPHQQLAGAMFEDRDDEQLANPGSFPPVPYFRPQDHQGCLCRIADLPIVVTERGARSARLQARPTSSPPAVGRIRGGLVVISRVARTTQPAWWPRALRREWPAQLRRAARAQRFG